MKKLKSTQMKMVYEKFLYKKNELPPKPNKSPPAENSRSRSGQSSFIISIGIQSNNLVRVQNGTNQEEAKYNTPSIFSP